MNFQANDVKNKNYVLNNKGWIALIDHMGDESSIIRSARITFGGLFKQQDGSSNDEQLLKFLIKHDHMSPFEHVILTFLVYCPMFIKNQWMRHRTWSYSEISRRNTNVNIDFYNIDDEQIRFIGEDKDKKDENVKTELAKIIRDFNSKSLEQYNYLIDQGIPMEQARGVLSQNMMVTFFGTVNMRNLINFIKLRDHYSAQQEIREYAVTIKKIIKPMFPILSKYFWDL